MFRTVPLTVIRSCSLHTQQWYMSYRLADNLREGLRRNWLRPDLARKLTASLYDIYHCFVYNEKIPDDGQRNYPKHVEFYSKNKLDKLVHLVGFIIRNTKIKPVWSRR